MIVLSFPADTPTKTCKNDVAGYKRLLAANKNIAQYICCDLPHAKDKKTYGSSDPTGDKLVDELKPLIHDIIKEIIGNLKWYTRST